MNLDKMRQAAEKNIFSMGFVLPPYLYIYLLFESIFSKKQTEV